MVLDNFKNCLEKEISFPEMQKHLEQSRNQTQKEVSDLGCLPEFPILNPEEVELSAREFEQIYKTKKKSEALFFFSNLSAHCRRYIMSTQPYQTYWKTCRIQV